MIALGRIEKDGSSALQYLLARPPLTILASFSIFYLFLIQVFRWISYRDPTSYFFSSSSAYTPTYSEVRIAEADAFLHNAEELPRPRTSGQPLTMCLGISTVTRTDDQHVRRTVSSLIEGLSEGERGSLYVTVLVAHSQPSKHPIYQEPWIDHLPNKVLYYKDDDMESIRQWEESKDNATKTAFDYTYLLDDCYKTGAKYVAMIDDDMLAVEGWYPRALLALHKVEKEMEGEKRAGQDWGFLRLFFVEDFLGWKSEFWISYLAWSFIFWAIATSAIFVVRSRYRNTTTQTFLSNPCIAVISAICLPALVALFFMAGRNTNRPFAAGIHEMNNFPCCSQGYVFPSHIIPAFLEKARIMVNWPIHTMAEDIANQNRWARWTEIPALLQHSGRSNGLNSEAGRGAWNFGFEMYRKSTLGRH